MRSDEVIRNHKRAAQIRKIREKRYRYGKEVLRV